MRVVGRAFCASSAAPASAQSADSESSLHEARMSAISAIGSSPLPPSIERAKEVPKPEGPPDGESGPEEVREEVVTSTYLPLPPGPACS